MPLYEYRCRSCRRRFTKLFRSISAVGDPGPCPHCGARDVERLLSRVFVHRTVTEPARSEIADGDNGMEDMFDSAEETWEDEDESDVPDFPDTEDPRELARWMREMSAQTGEPLDPSLERAVQDLERGEDPERVLERLEEETLQTDSQEYPDGSTDSGKS